MHPQANNGPVLTLPAGWEPCWTSSEFLVGERRGRADSRARRRPRHRDDSTRLAKELHELGWIVFSAKNDRDDWDLFQMRPDGSDRRQITDTPDFNEAGARFSRDGKRLLYYRLPKTEAVDNNTYGTFELVLADADGGQCCRVGKGIPLGVLGTGRHSNWRA